MIWFLTVLLLCWKLDPEVRSTDAICTSIFTPQHRQQPFMLLESYSRSAGPKPTPIALYALPLALPLPNLPKLILLIPWASEFFTSTLWGSGCFWNPIALQTWSYLPKTSVRFCLGDARPGFCGGLIVFKHDPQQSTGAKAL